MKPLILSTSDIGGGAAVAGYRLHAGLRSIGQDSQMLVREKLSQDEAVTLWPSVREASDAWLDQLTNDLRLKARTPLSTTYFSLPWPGEAVATHPLVQAADVLHLHWAGHFISPEGLRDLLSLGKPVLWTLHDQRAFTGGCHYSAGCEGFMRDCAQCPQLRTALHEVPVAALALSEACWSDVLRPVIVAPSEWLAAEARRSRLFKDCRVEVIPYGLDLKVFQRREPAAARAHFGLPQEALVVVFGAQSLAEPRKGFDLVQAAIETLLMMPEIAAMVERRQLVFAAYGQSGDLLRQTRLPLVLLGEQTCEADMARVLSAADLFICPSREDNLPNTVMEAMACGVPVLGANVGGIPDMISDGVHGRLVPANDAAALAEALLQLIQNRATWRHWGTQARDKCEHLYALHHQAKAYARLYAELLAGPASVGVIPPHSSLIETAQATMMRVARQVETTLRAETKALALAAEQAAMSKPSAKASLKSVEDQLATLRRNPFAFLLPKTRQLKQQRDQLREALQLEKAQRKQAKAKPAAAAPTPSATPAPPVRLSSIGGYLSQVSAVVTAAEINDRHGTGVLLARLFKDEANYLHLRSRDLYGGITGGAQQLCIPPSYDAASVLPGMLHGSTLRRILSVPYDRSDVANTLALHALTGAPLCSWIMDHNLGDGPDQIPAAMMQQLLDRSSLCLGISPEICQLYGERFGRMLHFAPPVVDACLGQRELLHLPPTAYLPATGVLLGNVWSQRWLKKLAETVASAHVPLVAYGHKSPQWVKHDALAAHVDMRGFLPEDELVLALRALPFAVVPTGMLDEQDDLPEIARYSLPSRTLYLSAVGNLPIIVVGHEDSGVARFVTTHDLGVVVPYEGKTLRRTVQWICQPEQQLRFRRRAAQMAPAFACDDMLAWVWRSLELARPCDDRWSNASLSASQS
jgi:glycosyltransferase involved in cell wall biosynthesis